MDVPAGLAVVSEILRVLICLSMNPFDFGQRDEEVMCSMLRDVRKDEKGSEEKGGPLSE